MEDPYDWDLGYENLGGKGPRSASNRRSHTTALRDRHDAPTARDATAAPPSSNDPGQDGNATNDPVS